MRPLSAFEEVRVDTVGGLRWPHPLRPLGLHRPLQRRLLQPVVNEPRRRRLATRVQELHAEAAMRVRGPRDPRLTKAHFHGNGPSLDHGRVAGALGPHAGQRGCAAHHAAYARSAFSRSRGPSKHYYASPWPLSERHYLVAWSDRKLPPHCGEDSDDRNPANAQGIYLYDAFGNLNLLCRDPAISSVWPIALRARPQPPVLPSTVAWDGPQEGRFTAPGRVPRAERHSAGVDQATPRDRRAAQDAALHELALAGRVGRGARQVRARQRARGKRRLGLFPRALGRADVLPGPGRRRAGGADHVQLGLRAARRNAACIGCHESRDSAPAVGRVPLASAREPSKLKPGPAGSWPLRFDDLVQPVLDGQCVRCHSPAEQRGQGRQARPHARQGLRQPLDVRRQEPPAASSSSATVRSRATARRGTASCWRC